MRPFDDGRRRAAELEAYHALWNLWRTSKQRAAAVSNWESACEMLQTYYTVARARRDSEVCAMRIRYLEVSEPPPRLADFVYGPPYGRVADAPRQLAQARYEYQIARLRHPQRERLRQTELETTNALHQTVKWAEARAELARRREWQQSRWPRGVALDAEIYNLDSIAAQVERQNAKIGSQVAALTDLLRDGLHKLPDVSASDLTASYRAGDPAGIAAYVESALTALVLPPPITPKAKVSYSPVTRESVVEYELPSADVVPKATSYRYVKSREVVVEKARPASAVKALYTSAIAQLAILSVAAIWEFDSERYIDRVVFSGFVDALDSHTGQPIRPCLITVRVSRETFAGIDLEHVDLPACLERLSGTVSQDPTRYRPLTR